MVTLTRDYYEYPCKLQLTSSYVPVELVVTVFDVLSIRLLSNMLERDRQPDRRTEMKLSIEDLRKSKWFGYSVA